MMEYRDITIKCFLLYIKEIDRMHKKIENRDKRLTASIAENFGIAMPKGTIGTSILETIK